MKTVILIDGQNMHYDFEDLKILEIDVDWDKFLKSLINKDDELARTYWFRPERLLDTHFTDFKIKNRIVLKQFNPYFDSFCTREYDSIPKDVLVKIEEAAQPVIQWLKSEKERFNRIEYNYDSIVLCNEDIEIVKCGGVKIDPYKQIYIGEKGVDIALAVKMIALSVENRCDKIILISGDYDYAEAIKFVKNNMTKIHIVKIHKGYPPKNKSMSRDLSVLADKLIDVYESDIRSKFMKTAKKGTN